jgi:predicted regulator of Ras-like GTPase activity (Roadblock/LC7/MglB family)
MVAVSDQEHRITLQELTTILEEQLRKATGIQSITVLSPDGLPIASTLLEREHITSAMAAASLGLSERVVETLNRGKMEEIMISGNQGFVVIRAAGKNAAISITAKEAINHGFARIIAKKIALIVEERL